MTPGTTVDHPLGHLMTLPLCPSPTPVSRPLIPGLEPWGEPSWTRTVTGHGHVLPPECAPHSSGLSGGQRPSRPRHQATSGYHASRADLISCSNTESCDFASRTCHNVPMMWPRPQGTSMSSPGPKPVSLGGRRGPGEEQPVAGISSRLHQGRDDMTAWQQGGLKLPPLMPQPQLAGQELGPRLPLSQLGPGHHQEA
jgi:hypothetical protein